MKHYGILATSNNHTLNCFDFLAQFLSFQSINLSGSTCCLTQSGCHCQPFQSCLCQHKYKNYYEMANTNELKGIFVDFLSQINCFGIFCLTVVLLVYQSPILCSQEFILYTFLYLEIILVCFACLFSKQRKGRHEVGQAGRIWEELGEEKW